VTIVLVAGTGTEIGKTYVAAQLAAALREHGTTVAARKPVQSFAAGETGTDAAVLAAATGEPTELVCAPHRSLAAPMAPPIAAAVLGAPAFTIADLVGELAWPSEVAVGVVEGAGGLRSPLADDGDTASLIEALAPDDVLVVAPAGLGAIHGVRLVVDALTGRRVTVALNRYDHCDGVHRANSEWLTDRDGLSVVTAPDVLADRWAYP